MGGWVRTSHWVEDVKLPLVHLCGRAEGGEEATGDAHEVCAQGESRSHGCVEEEALSA